jgi:hypothetical protein
VPNRLRRPIFLFSQARPARTISRKLAPVSLRLATVVPNLLRSPIFPHFFASDAPKSFGIFRK